jgi:hypothetical protein
MVSIWSRSAYSWALGRELLLDRVAALAFFDELCLEHGDCLAGCRRRGLVWARCARRTGDECVCSPR